MNIGQNLFETLQEVCDFTPLEDDMWQIVRAIERDNAELFSKKNVVLADVSNQRELMILTAQFCMNNTLTDAVAEQIVDAVIKNQ